MEVWGGKVGKVTHCWLFVAELTHGHLLSSWILPLLLVQRIVIFGSYQAPLLIWLSCPLALLQCLGSSPLRKRMLSTQMQGFWSVVNHVMIALNCKKRPDLSQAVVARLWFLHPVLL